MTTDFRDIRPTVEPSRLHDGDENDVQRNRIRRSPRTLLNGADNESLESNFALPSARAETGALLERQLLISGGLGDARLPRTLGDPTVRRLSVIFGIFVLAVLGAGSALYVQYEKMQEEWQTEMGVRNEAIVAAQADNERLLRVERETGSRLEKTAAELSREVTEKKRIAEEADRTKSELNLARQNVLSLRGEIGGLMERYRKLEADRLAELGVFLRESFLLPLERLRSMAMRSPATVGPLPKAAATGRVPLVRSPRTFTERAAPRRQGDRRAQSAIDD